MLSSNLPCHTRRRYLLINLSIIHIRSIVISPIIRISTFKKLQIRETSSNIVTTYLTIRITKLKHIHPFQILLNNRFFRNIPCKRKSREKTKTVAFGKVFTSIIAKIKINKITIIPIEPILICLLKYTFECNDIRVPDTYTL